MSTLRILVPAQAGTHSSAVSNCESNDNFVPAMIGAYRGKMDPGFRRGKRE
jgi:hypothetical protein